MWEPLSLGCYTPVPAGHGGQKLNNWSWQDQGENLSVAPSWEGPLTGWEASSETFQLSSAWEKKEDLQSCVRMKTGNVHTEQEYLAWHHCHRHHHHNNMHLLSTYCMPDPALSAVQLWTHFILTTIPRGRGDYYSHYIDEQTEACRDYITLSWGDNFTTGDIWVAKKKKKSWVARKHPSLDRRSFDLAELRGSTVLRGRFATWNKSNLIAYVGRHFLLGSQSLKS